jgi:catechol 2,3-dioxygenase-like lactoylglutathione lyase family enzyme
MAEDLTPSLNVRQAVPFLRVSNMEASLRFYLDGLGFRMAKNWMVEGRVRWCWLEIGDAALMLQEFRTEGENSGKPAGRLGEGVSICFICEDALVLYREFKSRSIDVSTPFVGNGMWVTGLKDPDGYRLEFESETETPEETVYSGSEA